MVAEVPLATVIVLGDVTLPEPPEGCVVVSVSDAAAVEAAAADCDWPLVVALPAELASLPASLSALKIACCVTPDDQTPKDVVGALPLWEPAAARLALAVALGVRQRVRTSAEAVATTAADHEAFVHAVSHDLKGPLQGIIGLAGLLMQQSGVRVFPEVEAYAGRIEGEADRLASMVSALTAYTRLGRPRVNPETIELGPIVDEVCASAIRRYTERFPRFQVAPGMPTVLADAGLVSLAITALVDNAVNFTDDSPPLVVIAWSPPVDGRLTLTVRDEGIGLSEHGIDAVFEMFTRLDKRRGDGLGTGLPMARRAAELCGGTLTLTSDPDQGTTAHLTLPAGS